MLGAIHEFTIRHRTSASVTPEGVAVDTYTDEVVRGHIGYSPEDVKSGTGAELATVGKFAEVQTYIVRLPADVTVDNHDQIISTGNGYFDGTYEVIRILVTVRHIRVFVRRVKY